MTNHKETSVSRDPLWYQDAIIYELHVRAFYDSTGDGIGDFKGLIQKLDYLQDLGVTALWLLPFYPSPLRDDGYDIADYRSVHPDYGSLADCRLFMQAAHARGLKVITELVINHTSDQHPWFQAARRAKTGSQKRNYYVWSNTDTRYPETPIIFLDTEKANWSWDPLAGAYYWHRFFSHQPDLNYANPQVLKAVFRIMRFWLDLGVDGFRLDAVPYLCERDGTKNEGLPETHAVLKEMRRLLDQHYDARMFLAEANQWPEDVRSYFGEDDECHMAFHFPLMPRIFMALRQEDRYPITEILRRTPDIPETCQWALFLRNHDELTLEMVTDEERDYMYREYAVDPRMRINRGIRRRLATLAENHLGRIQLLYSLLFSLPGTPVLYYGDEIGMGDNIFLGDRNSVRTPMQWSSDRNAGFSRADPQRLYAPVIMDPVYGYQAVNVESQERDTSSLLWWMKRIIARRKQHRVFGRGRLAILSPQNRKVLAYVRYDENETVLVLANLSQQVQPVELDLSAYQGMIPREMFGQTEFPAIGATPYFLAMGPYAFYWFALHPAPEPVVIWSDVSSPDTPAELETALPVLELTGNWPTLFSRGNWRLLQADVLPAYLARQRWFHGKERTMTRLRLVNHGFLQTTAPLITLTIVEVVYKDGGTETYALPLSISADEATEALLQTEPGSVLARVRSPQGDGLLHDALSMPAVGPLLLDLLQNQRHVSCGVGEIQAFTTAAYLTARGPIEEELPVSRVLTRQSNSSLIYGNRLVLKLIRRLEAGINAELEMGRHLTEELAFPYTAPLAGGLAYHRPGAEPTTLAILQGYVRSGGHGWDYTLDLLKRYYEDTLGRAHETVDVEPNNVPRMLADASRDIPEQAMIIVSTYLVAAENLGQRTAALHLALAQDTRHAAFAPEAMTATDLDALATTLSAHALQVLEELEHRVDTFPEPLYTQARDVLEQRTTCMERLHAVSMVTPGVARMRCHGDYHLGQVLWVENTFIIIDFEGQPEHPMVDRRRKHSPLTDVAGMLRSFSQVAYTALATCTQTRPDDMSKLAPWAHFWQHWTSVSFLRSYLQTTAGAAFVPPEPGDLAVLLEALLLEKLLDELHAELHNHLDGLHVPLQGLSQLLCLPVR